jgi:hypothetical protein
MKGERGATEELDWLAPMTDLELLGRFAASLQASQCRTHGPWSSRVDCRPVIRPGFDGVREVPLARLSRATLYTSFEGDFDAVRRCTGISNRTVERHGLESCHCHGRPHIEYAVPLLCTRVMLALPLTPTYSTPSSPPLSTTRNATSYRFIIRYVYVYRAATRNTHIVANPLGVCDGIKRQRAGYTNDGWATGLSGCGSRHGLQLLGGRALIISHMRSCYLSNSHELVSFQAKNRARPAP